MGEGRSVSWYLLRARSGRRRPVSRAARETKASAEFFASSRAFERACHAAALSLAEVPEASAISEKVGQPEALERHSGCLFSGREGSFAPISALSSEGRCTRCISTIAGVPRCP